MRGLSVYIQYGAHGAAWHTCGRQLLRAALDSAKERGEVRCIGEGWLLCVMFALQREHHVSLYMPPRWPLTPDVMELERPRGVSVGDTNIGSRCAAGSMGLHIIQ
jgi:hypothetical protein